MVSDDVVEDVITLDLECLLALKDCCHYVCSPNNLTALQMKMRYHHVIMSVHSPQMPYRYWRFVTSSVKVIYAAYGIRRDGPNEPHTLYMLYEDDTYLRSYRHYLKKNKDRIQVFHEEHNMTKRNLLNVRSTYLNICPRNFQIDNIDDFLKHSV